MNKKIIIGLAVGFIIAGLVWIAKPAPNQQANLSEAVGGDLEAEETAFNFGKISMAGGKVSHDFKIKNSGDKSVALDKLYTSCMCTAAYFFQDGERIGPFGMVGHGFVPSLKKVIAGGEEAVISVTFDPAAHGPAGVGPIERVVYLENKSGILLELSIAANVTP